MAACIKIKKVMRPSSPATIIHTLAWTPFFDLRGEFRLRKAHLFLQEVRQILQHIGKRAYQRRIANPIKWDWTGSLPASFRVASWTGYHSTRLPAAGGPVRNHKLRRC